MSGVASADAMLLEAPHEVLDDDFSHWICCGMTLCGISYPGPTEEPEEWDRVSCELCTRLERDGAPCLNPTCSWGGGW